MKYQWKITPEINQLLIRLEAQKIALENTTSLPHIELAIRKRSLLRSAVYSARIEGLPDEESLPKKASQNLLLSYNFIHSGATLTFSLSQIKKLHLLVMRSLSSNAGIYRSEPWAIFNQAGVAVYLAPMHFEVPQMMEDYIEYVASLNDHPAVIAAVAQFVFEKIHPFADGNGRVGRLISALLLTKQGYGLRGLIPFEIYVESHRAEFYSTLESSTQVTDFIAFFLKALTSGIDEVIKSLSSGVEKREDLLLPRRQEILHLLSDHPLSTFDYIRRRFMSVNPKTLQYDISQLTKKGFVEKVGTTKGALYKKA